MQLRSDSDRIAIGELADLYHISTRTLRLYHDMGLLIPQYVDDHTGYRYYSSVQFPRLEMIMQMKAAGLSLKRIKTMLNTKNLSMFEALINEQIDELDEKIVEYTRKRNSLVKQLDSCKHLRNPPVLDTVFIEFLPKRRAAIFQIEEYDFLKSYPEGSPWKIALEKIKKDFAASNVPLTYFHQVGCLIPQEALLENRFLCSGAFILIDSASSQLSQSVIQSGTYACMYRRYIAMDNQSESVGLQELLKYIRDNSYVIVGPYLGEIIAETSVFDYDNQNILVKLQIPVKIIGE